MAHENPAYRDISAWVRGIVFMGTPHRGSNQAQWGTLVGKILWPMNMKSELVSALEPNSETFKAIAEAFLLRANYLSIFTYYEQRKMERYGISAMIVPEESAILYFPGELRYPMERDHTSMCCFASQHDRYYKSIVDNIRKFVVQPRGKELVAGEEKSSAKLDECLQWMEVKGGLKWSASAPGPVAGTCEWLFHQKHFQDWLSFDTSSGLLWITGPFGSGKTVLSTFLAKTLGEHLLEQPSVVGPVTVCYFSCDQQFNRETDVLKMVNTLLHQILYDRNELANHAMREWDKPGQRLLEKFETLWDVFVATLEDPRTGYTIIVIDAIDECAQATQEMYVDSFKKLLSNTGKIRVLFTSQHTTQIESKFHHVPIMQMEDRPYCDFVGEDVNLVIQHELDDSHRYSAGERDYLTKALRERADRTFLWIKFVVQELRDLTTRTRSKLQAVIDGVPKDLTERYKQSLFKLKEDTNRQEGALKLLKIVSASLRPLDLEEISFARSVSNVHDSLFDIEQDRIINIEESIRDILGSLVRITDGRIQFVHSSLNRYLSSLSNRREDDGCAIFAITPEVAHLEMAKICTNYLSLQDFDRKDFDHTPYFSGPTFNSPVPDQEDLGIDLMFKSEERGTTGRRPKFFDYCALNWATHVAIAGQRVTEDPDLLRKIIKISTKDSFVLYNWLECYWSTLGPKKEKHKDFSPLVVASYFGLEAVVSTLIVKRLVDTNECGPSALLWAAMEGQSNIVRLLLTHGVSPEHRSLLGWTPLTSAAAAGHSDIVQTLLSVKGINVNDTSSPRKARTALSYAIGNGHFEASRLLLEHPDIDVNKIDDNRGNTPLLHAMGDGNVEIIHLLLDHGQVEVHHQDCYGRTSLSYAAEYGHVAVVEVLLAQQPELLKENLEDNDNRSPLLYAAKAGHLKIMQILQDVGKLDISSADREGFNAVIFASKYQHLHILQYLLIHDPEGFRAVDRDGTPPLGFPFIGNGPRRLETVELLLNSGLVDLSQTEKEGRTLLFRAAASGFVEGVICMLNRGANVNATDNRGLTPLHLVVVEGRIPEMVTCLLERGADLTIRDGNGLTPLEYVKSHAQYTNSEIVAVLGKKTKEMANLKGGRIKARKGRPT